MSEYGAAVEWYWQGKTDGLEEKPIPVSLCPQQISHGLTWERTRPSAERSRRLTSWAVERPRLQDNIEMECRWVEMSVIGVWGFGLDFFISYRDQWRAVGNHKSRRNFWLAEWLSVSQEGLSFMELEYENVYFSINILSLMSFVSELFMIQFCVWKCKPISNNENSLIIWFMHFSFNLELCVKPNQHFYF
jgi:hypothetical protein